MFITRSYQLCLSMGLDICTNMFSLEMRIPFVEKKQVIEIEDQEDGIEDSFEESKENDESIISKGIFTVIASNNELTVTEGTLKVIHDNEFNQVQVKDNTKLEKEIALTYSKLIRIVEITLFISLTIIFLSFICLICLFLT